MRRALELARRGGSHPNPCVGAVLLDGAGNPVGEGVTDRWPDTVHAERRALEAAGGRGEVMVVSLEPCDHTGRSEPCTGAIIRAGIGRVVVGSFDPDERVGGRGVQRLRDAGIEVEAPVATDEVEAADPAYFHHRRTGLPRFVVKWASTLDGQTAALDGTSQWLTGPDARADAHRLRASADAVMVGSGTVRADDPLLTVRHVDHPGPDPRAVVVAGADPLPPTARLWGRSDTIVYATRSLDLPVEVAVVPGEGGRPDPTAVARDLAGRGVLAVVVEGGATLVGALFRSGLVEAGVIYLGAALAGGTGMPAMAGPWRTMVDAVDVEITGVTRIGPDAKVTWDKREPGTRESPPRL